MTIFKCTPPKLLCPYPKHTITHIQPVVPLPPIIRTGPITNTPVVTNPVIVPTPIVTNTEVGTPSNHFFFLPGSPQLYEGMGIMLTVILFFVVLNGIAKNWVVANTKPVIVTSTANTSNVVIISSNTKQVIANTA